jgi:hypothetical protein
MAKVQAARPVPPLQVDPANWSTWTVERRTLAQLKPHPRNPMVHPEAQIGQLCALIAELGFAKVSIVVDETDTILAGHGNVQALKRFGDQIKDVPVTVVRGWTDHQKLKFLLADNKTGRNSRYNRELLAPMVVELGTLPGVDLAMLGFRTAELAKIIPADPPEAVTDAPGAADVLAPMCRAGDVWQLGVHRLVVGETELDAADAIVKRWERLTKLRATRAAGAQVRGRGRAREKRARSAKVTKGNNGPQPNAGGNPAPEGQSPKGGEGSAPAE